MPTILEVIGISKASQFLATTAILKGGLYGKGLDLQLPRKLYSIRKNVEYRYQQEDIAGGETPSAALVSVSNKLYSLCYAVNEATAIFNGGSGGGSVTPVNPGVVQPYYFNVGAGEFFDNGDSSKTLPSEWGGKNIIFSRGGVNQSTVASEPSYFSWNPTTRIFTVTPAATTGELFSIIPS